jgi:hypothetical protein
VHDDRTTPSGRCGCHRGICRLESGDPRHGTVNGYTNLGCGCVPCRAAHSVKCLERRVARSAGPIPDRVHGTPGGYGNYRCTCGDCRRAWAKDTGERAKRRRERLASLAGTVSGKASKKDR